MYFIYLVIISLISFGLPLLQDFCYADGAILAVVLDSVWKEDCCLFWDIGE